MSASRFWASNSDEVIIRSHRFRGVKKNGDWAGRGAGWGSVGGGPSVPALPALVDPPFATVVLLVDDGVHGATTFTDLSGTPKTMARVGTVKHDDADVVFAGDTSSLLFAGDGGISAADHDDLDLTGDYGMDCWAKTSLSNHNILICKYNSTSQRAFRFHIGETAAFYHFSQRGGSGSFNTFSLAETTPDDGEWHHMYFVHEVYDGGTKQVGRLFIDGVFQNETLNTNLPIDATTNPLWLGQDDKSNSRFTGRMAWPRVWHGAHGATEDFAVATESPPLS